MKKKGIGLNKGCKFKIVSFDGVDCCINSILSIGNYCALRLLKRKRIPIEVSDQFFFTLPRATPFCLTEVIALAGHASTQILQVLPTHFTLSN